MRAVTAAVAVLVALVPAAAAAQTCGAADLVAAVPRNGAIGVPLGAPLYAFYGSTAIYGSDDVQGQVTLEVPDGEPRGLAARLDLEGKLTVEAELEPRTTYILKWPGLRSSTAGVRGRGRSVTFTTGDRPDLDPPAFAGATGLDWNWERVEDDCTEGQEDRFTFDIALGQASDDGGRDSLTLAIMQTAGPEVGAARQVLARELPEPGQPVRISLAAAKAAGRVCFAALVRDLVPAHSPAGGDHEVCVTTTRPPFFNGCSLAPAGSPRAPLVPLFALGLFLLLRRRRA